jgi:hypothetical protein
MRKAWSMSWMAVGGAVALASLHPVALQEAGPAGPAPATLENPAQLSPAPGEPPVAVLMAGARLQVVEQREGWSRVTLEGWIPQSALPASAAEPAPVVPAPAPSAVAAAPAAAAPAEAPAQPSSAAALRGVVFVTGDKGETLAGGGVAVRLLQAAGPALAMLETHRRECAARQAELSAQAEELKDRAGRALRTIDNATRAFEESDRLKGERDAVRQRRVDEWRRCREQEEELIDAHAAHRAITSEGGRYAFDGVPSGRYTLQAALDTGRRRHDWLLPIVLEAGAPRTMDLTTRNQASVQDVPQAP